MSALLLIFVSMLLAWNAVPQPDWCKSFWEWTSTVWTKKQPTEKCGKTEDSSSEKCEEKA